MADTETKATSLALYHYMCQTIVGYENHVKTMRLMHSVRDNVICNTGDTFITSGSFGEGLELRGCDLDMMCVRKNFEVHADEKTRLNPNFNNFRMETDDVKPGFTQLLVENTDNKHLFQFYEELNGKLYFSSTLFKHSYLPSLNIKHYRKIHGPCVSDQAGFFDRAICLHCKTWISQASQWISRSSNSWPSHNVKQSIIKHGVLFVPIGVKGSPKENIEWRISFSVGEKFLINTFTHTQLICYALLKILLKDVIATYKECEDLLCSYFLKTIIFWISEELPQSIWKPENLIHCFMQCLRRLVYSVDYSVCLHYFIPENNMFENKIAGRAREILLEKLNNLHSYGWRCILFSNQFSNFHVSTCMVEIEAHTLHYMEVANVLNSLLLCLTNCVVRAFDWDFYANKRGLQQIVSCHQSSLKYLYTYYISLWCGRGAQKFPLNISKSSNKHQYKQYKSCLCTLLQNIYHDSVSGWLMLASFFYKIKQYETASTITEYSISKCTPEKLCYFMDMSSIHHQLLKLKSFQKKSIVQLWKIMLTDEIIFQNTSELLPDELQEVIDMSIVNHHIDPLPYAYALNFFCYSHLHDDEQYDCQCQDCIHCRLLCY